MNVRALLVDLFAAVFRPLIATDSVWRWADANVLLSGTATGKGGPYRSAFTPWNRRLHDVFIDPLIREAHVMKSSRVGVTEAGFNIIRYMPEHAPGPAQFAITSANKATDANKGRLTPTLKKFTEGPEAVDPDDVTGRIIRLRNMEIRFTGSASEAAFRGEGARLVVVDEVEENDSTIRGAGTLHNLARSRTVGVDFSKVITMSKARAWGSPHHRECASGTLEAFLVPCPHCGTYQELSFEGPSPTAELALRFRAHGAIESLPVPEPASKLGRLEFSDCKLLDDTWDLDRVQRETRYRCVSGCLIDGETLLAPVSREHFEPAAALDLAYALDRHGAAPPAYTGQGPAPARATHRRDGFHGAAEVLRALDSGRPIRTKWAMMQAGQWLRTNPRPEPFKVSQHISDLYSLHDDMTWGDLARIFLKNKSEADGVRFFRNNHLGVPFRETRAEVNEEHFLECLAPYTRGECPFVPDVCVIGADTQDPFWKFVTVAARLDRAGVGYVEVAVVRWGVAPTESELMAELKRPVRLATGTPAPDQFPILGFIDPKGHRTDQVYRLHFRSGFRFMPCQGEAIRAGAAQPWWFREKEILLDGTTPTKINLYHLIDDFWKRRLYHGMIGRGREIKDCIYRQQLDPAALSLPPRLLIPAHPGDAERRDFLAELQAEKLDPATEKWAKIRSVPNDYGDALKIALVCLETQIPWVLRHRAKAAAAATKKPAAPQTV